jgi:DNA-binding response OmpR family regulator
VVEDNSDCADSLRLVLEARGHAVRVARTGAEGVAVAREWQPEVIFADLGLPVLDGFCLAKELRPTGVRMIAISGYGGEEFGREARSCGFEQLLVKPADPDTLLHLLEK